MSIPAVAIEYQRLSQRDDDPDDDDSVRESNGSGSDVEEWSYIGGGGSRGQFNRELQEINLEAATGRSGRPRKMKVEMYEVSWEEALIGETL